MATPTPGEQSDPRNVGSPQPGPSPVHESGMRSTYSTAASIREASAATDYNPHWPDVASQAGLARLGTALALVAIGSLAIGAFAIGRLSVRTLRVKKGSFRKLRIQELEIDRLTVRDNNLVLS